MKNNRFNHNAVMARIIAKHDVTVHTHGRLHTVSKEGKRIGAILLQPKTRNSCYLITVDFKAGNEDVLDTVLDDYKEQKKRIQEDVFIEDTLRGTRTSI